MSLVSYSSDRLEICANVRLFDCCHGGRILCVYYFIFCFLFCLFFLFFCFLVLLCVLCVVCCACCCRCLRSVAEPEMNSECASLNLAVRVCCFAVDIGAIICFRWYRCMLGHVMVVFRGVL